MNEGFQQLPLDTLPAHSSLLLMCSDAEHMVCSSAATTASPGFVSAACWGAGFQQIIVCSPGCPAVDSLSVHSQDFLVPQGRLAAEQGDAPRCALALNTLNTGWRPRAGDHLPGEQAAPAPGHDRVGLLALAVRLAPDRTGCVTCWFPAQHTAQQMPDNTWCPAGSDSHKHILCCALHCLLGRCHDHAGLRALSVRLAPCRSGCAALWACGHAGLLGSYWP